MPAQPPRVQARTSPSRSHAPRRSDGPRTPATAPPPVPHPVPAAREEEAAVPSHPPLPPMWLLSPPGPQCLVTGPGGGDRKRTPSRTPGATAHRRPPAGAGVQTERSGRSRGGGGGTASRPGPSPWPTPGGGGTYCGGCGLAPSGWRRRISRPSRSTPGAGTEPPSARRRSPAISPRVRPPPTRSPPRWCPRSRGRCYCRRCRCRHCALPASPAARMRSVTPRSPGCGRAGPEAGEAWRGGAGGRGEVRRVNAAGFPWLRLATAGWRPARWDSFLAASRLTQRGGGMTGPTCAAALGSAVAAPSAVASSGSAPMTVQIAR